MSELVIPVLDLRDADLHKTDGRDVDGRDTDQDAGPDTRAAFHRRLRDAARDVGFLQLTGHGIPTTRMTEILDLTRAFFHLPQADLDALSNLNSPHFRGYTQVGHERTGGRADRREQLDVALERPAAPPTGDEPAYRWLHGPNQWPAALPELRPAVLAWIDDVSAVADRLLRELLTALGAPRDSFAAAFAHDPHVHLKLIHYPGTDQNDQNDQGVGAHKDYGFLSLLLSDGVPGLQVATSDGAFVDVPHLPGAFVVNLGELLELATRGHLSATRHRVLSPPAGRERFSVAVFHNPNLDYRVRPLPIEPVAGASGVLADPDNPLLDVYGENAMKGWLRAHPEVARRHHPDLVPNHRSEVQSTQE